jgi:hypothetical protein
MKPNRFLLVLFALLAVAVAVVVIRAPGTDRDGPALEVLEAGVVQEASGRFIAGRVRNNSLGDFRYVQVEFDLFSATGDKVGTAFANVSGLKRGETWAFRAGILHGEAASFRLKEVTGY